MRPRRGALGLGVALLALALPPARAGAQGVFAGVVEGDAPRVERLPNGLTVVTARTDAPGIVAYYTLVRVGARDEVEEGHSGFAHLFEHMMFRGTEAFGQDRYEAAIQSFGANNNAYTTQDYTLYTVTAPAAVLDEIVALEADRFQNLAYSEDVFRTETGAVRGEYDTRAASPFQPMWEALSELAFTEHTYGHTTLGYLHDIERMPERYDYSRRFFERFYTPDNTTIIVAGDVDHDALLREVRARYGAWRGRRDEPRVPREPAPAEGRSRHIHWQAPAAPRMLVGWRTPAFVTDRGAARAAALRETAALRAIHGLVFSEASPLYRQEVVEERRALRLSSWADDAHLDPHLFVASAVLAEGERFAPLLARMQGALDALAAGEVDAERLEAVKSHVRYATLSDLQTPSDVAELIAEHLALGPRPRRAGGRPDAAAGLALLDDYLAALAAVTAEDVTRVAGRYLTEERRVLVTLSSDPAPDAPAAPDATPEPDEASGEPAEEDTTAWRRGAPALGDGAPAAAGGAGA